MCRESMQPFFPFCSHLPSFLTKCLKKWTSLMWSPERQCACSLSSDTAANWFDWGGGGGRWWVAGKSYERNTAGWRQWGLLYALITWPVGGIKRKQLPAADFKQTRRGAESRHKTGATSEQQQSRRGVNKLTRSNSNSHNADSGVSAR